MVDYVESVKRPFTDLGKLILGIILSIIPIVNFIFSGYLLEVSKSAMKKDMELPEYKDYGKMFIEGILTAIIGFVYMLPVTILFVILVVTGTLAFGNLLTGGTIGIIGAIAGLGVYLVILAIVGVIFWILATAAILRFAEDREFSVAFDFSAVAKKAFNGHYVMNWLLTMVIVCAISFLINLIPFVGQLLAIYIAGVINMTALAQAYAEAK